MAFIEWFLHETSLFSLFNFGNRDVCIILLSRYLRMHAYGGAALVLGLFLWHAGNKASQIGSFMTMSLLGDALISYLLTLTADKIGRRRVLLIGSLLMTLAGTVFTFTKNYYVLLFAATVGVISPGAHEVGPFRAVEESLLAQLTPIEARTDVYAWFAVTSTLGMASGLCVSGWITFLLHNYRSWEWTATYPVIFAIYAVIGLIKAFLTLMLSERCEPRFSPTEEDMTEASAPLMSNNRTTPTKQPKNTIGKVKEVMTTKLSPESRPILIRLCLLFALNSFAQGMLPVTLMAWYANWWYKWFLVSRVGYAMAAVWLVASIANLFSASVARRLGLVRAMVYTHLPNAIFLALIPLASKWYVMLMLLLASSAFGSMDQAPRSAFVAAVFLPSERTAVMGTINLVKTLASAGGPMVTGYLYEKKMWHAAFFIAAALKILYDVGLLTMFLNTKLPEHGRNAREVTVNDVDVGILLNHQLVHPDEFEGVEVDDDDDENVRGNGYRYGHSKGTYEHVEHIERV